MKPRPKPSRSPRKTPVQARSQTTLRAIFDATIQVLLRDGVSALTTTRVAERAGVSVGTLYQYFPNKHALLAAILEQHLGAIAEAIEAECAAHHGCSVLEMMTALCATFIEAKIRDREASLALYALARELGAEAMVRKSSRRAQTALISMLASAGDATFADLEAPSFILVSATVGPVQALLEAGAKPESVAAMRRHLVELCVGYLERVKQ